MVSLLSPGATAGAAGPSALGGSEAPTTGASACAGSASEATNSERSAGLINGDANAHGRGTLPATVDPRPPESTSKALFASARQALRSGQAVVRLPTRTGSGLIGSARPGGGDLQSTQPGWPAGGRDVVRDDKRGWRRCGSVRSRDVLACTAGSSCSREMRLTASQCALHHQPVAADLRFVFRHMSGRRSV